MLFQALYISKTFFADVTTSKSIWTVLLEVSFETTRVGICFVAVTTFKWEVTSVLTAVMGKATRVLILLVTKLTLVGCFIGMADHVISKVRFSIKQFSTLLTGMSISLPILDKVKVHAMVNNVYMY